MAGPSPPLDLLILGAGIYGLCAASTYLTLHPSATLLVLDADTHPGGVWSRTRHFPRFHAQTGVRLSGFPDAAFALPDGAETFHDLFDARHLGEYFVAYLEREVGGEALRARFRFGVWVEGVWRGGGLWRARGKGPDGVVEVCARRVIVATGEFNEPFVPELPGRDVFGGPILHQKEFGRSKILTAEEPEKERHGRVTVLGGAKSAADIAYAAATDPNFPRKVTWIVSTSGSGPLMLSHPKGFGKYKSLAELASTRISAALSSANPFVEDSWWSWFAHRTPVGEWLLDKIWAAPANDAAKLADFEGREGRLEGFEGLRSSTVVRWRSGHQGILQHEDYWDIMARKVQVVRGDIERLEEGRIVMEDGRVVESDVILAGTGWVPQGHTILSAEEKARLGLPLNLKDESEFARADERHWRSLEEEADKKVLKRWPYLAYVPDFKKKPITSTPYRLYNEAIPIDDQSIAFLGVPSLPNSYHAALATALYAIAVLDGTHKLPPKESMEDELAFITRWCTRRYPVTGWLGNTMDFEMVSYTDKLLSELGLNSHRDGASWWGDLTDPCLASDYAGLVDEYRRKYGVDK